MHQQIHSRVKELNQIAIAKLKATMKQNLVICIICSVILFSILATNLFIPAPIRDQFVPVALCAFAIYISRVEYLKAKAKVK